MTLIRNKNPRAMFECNVTYPTVGVWELKKGEYVAPCAIDYCEPPPGRWCPPLTDEEALKSQCKVDFTYDKDHHFTSGRAVVEIRFDINRVNDYRASPSQFRDYPRVNAALAMWAERRTPRPWNEAVASTEHRVWVFQDVVTKIEWKHRKDELSKTFEIYTCDLVGEFVNFRLKSVDLHLAVFPCRELCEMKVTRSAAIYFGRIVHENGHTFDNLAATTMPTVASFVRGVRGDNPAGNYPWGTEPRIVQNVFEKNRARIEKFLPASVITGDSSWRFTGTPVSNPVRADDVEIGRHSGILEMQAFAWILNYEIRNCPCDVVPSDQPHKSVHHRLPTVY